MEQIESVNQSVSNFSLEGSPFAKPNLNPKEEELGKNIDEAKPFPIQSDTIFLTYRGQADKNWIRDWFKQNPRFKNYYPFKMLEIAHETGETGYEHTHILIDFGRKFQSNRCDTFDMPCWDGTKIHPNIKFVKTKIHRQNCIKYLTKQDPTNEHLLNQIEQPKICFSDRYDLAMTIEDDHEARKAAANSWSDIIPIDHVRRNRKPILNRFDWVPTKNWHEEIINLDKIVPDYRSIHWYYEKKGCTGKTAISKYLRTNFGNRWIIVRDLGTSRDASTIIANAAAKGWQFQGIVINLPRQSSDHNRMYEYLEEIKDGFVTATKYEGGTVCFDSPHVVVFANFPPRVGQLSMDRWKIREIQEDGDAKEICQYRLLDEQNKRDNFSINSALTLPVNRGS